MARKRCRKCRQPKPDGYVRPKRQPRPETCVQRRRRVAKEARQKKLAEERDQRLVSFGSGETVS